MSFKHSVLRFEFPDFANLQKTKSDPLTDSDGNKWRLRMDPKYNNGESDDEEAKIGVYLENLGNEDISTKYTFILRDRHGRENTQQTLDRVLKAKSHWGLHKFIERSKVLDSNENILVNGALVIDVHLQIKSSDDFMHKPPVSTGEKMLKVLENGEDADVLFKVGGDEIPAHKLMLKVNAPMLFEFCEGKGDGSTIIINNVAPDDFRTVLRYIYAEELPNAKSVKDNGTNILDAANRFGLLDLKLSIEASLVKLMNLTVDNAASWLVFAETKTCALLKEHAMSFIVARSEDILNNLEFSKQLVESPELLLEVTKELSKKSSGHQCLSEVSIPTVVELRKQLSKKGLDVDGTKEMLAARLNDSNKRQKTEK